MDLFRKFRFERVLFALLLLTLVGCVSAGDFVWLDENGNGVQDSGEPGVEGVAVALLGPDGVEIGTATTAADGSFQIQERAAAGEYSLQFTAPDGFAFTAADQGGDDEADSDADSASGETSTFTLAASEPLLNQDAGLIPLSAQAFEDEEEQTQEVTATPTATPEGSDGEAGGGAVLTTEQICYGPNPEDFPAGISPLTGLPVDDPSLLALRPVFLSISIFPPSVRPPTGLSVSPIVYQLYIGDGDTRLMAGFHGEFPEPDFDAGDGAAGEQPSDYDYLVGDRVWFDVNGNHLQDDGEPGISGVPVRLVDINLNTVQETETDGQGNYFFALSDIDPNTEFQVRFGAPPSVADYYFVNKDLGDDAVDSDVTEQGRSDFFDPTDGDPEQLNIDAGIRQAYRIEALRSGRVAYQDLQVNYCGCLVTAGADPTVAAQINTCGSAFGSDGSGIGGAGLDVTRLQGIATNNSEGSCAEPNLTGNSFCTQVEEITGQNGQELFMEYNINNKDHFVYDAALGAYTWAKNIPSDNENYVVMTDRLTGETLTWENVIVMRVEHTSQNSAGTIINLDMDFKQGTAFIFRNGQMYEALWTTVAGDYEQATGKLRPVRFTTLDGDPFPLAPGQTWINLVNAFDTVEMLSDGVWNADFDAPANP
jgi:hypothetical protein